MEKRIILSSRAPFEDALKPLDKGYFILGGLGVVVGLLKSGISGAMLLLLLALFLWWIVKANIALHKWRNLRSYTFSVDKQIPYEELVDKLTVVLTPFGLRVDLSDGKPQIVYRNIMLNVVYGTDMTFLMPWKQNASLLLFDYRYITSYYNTVAIMSIVGYYMQHLCSNSEAMEVSDKNSGPVVVPYDSPLKKRSRQRMAAPLLVGILTVLVIIMMPGKENEYITMVKEGYSAAYPDITYEEAFGAFFTNPKWKYFKSEDGRDVVEFTGGMTYMDHDVEGLFQFVIEDESNFTTECFAMNGIPQNNLMLYGVIAKIFESYGNGDTGIIREPVDTEPIVESEPESEAIPETQILQEESDVAEEESSDVGDTGEYDGYAASQDTGITSWDGNTTWDGERGIDGMLDSYFTGFEDSMIDAYLNQ